MDESINATARVRWRWLSPKNGETTAMRIRSTDRHIPTCLEKEWVIEGDFAARVKSIATVQSLWIMGSHTSDITIGKGLKLRMARP
jgi:hypothetical protein